MRFIRPWGAKEPSRLPAFLDNRTYIEVTGLSETHLAHMRFEEADKLMEELLDKDQKAFMKSMKTFPSVLRTGYAYLLLAKKDETEAKKVLEFFDKVAKTYPNKVDIDSERELLECAKVKALEPK